MEALKFSKHRDFLLCVLQNQGSAKKKLISFFSNFWMLEFTAQCAEEWTDENDLSKNSARLK